MKEREKNGEIKWKGDKKEEKKREKERKKGRKRENTISGRKIYI